MVPLVPIVNGASPVRFMVRPLLILLHERIMAQAPSTTTIRFAA
jgi:hypothetical protein